MQLRASRIADTAGRRSPDRLCLDLPLGGFLDAGALGELLLAAHTATAIVPGATATWIPTTCSRWPRGSSTGLPASYGGGALLVGHPQRELQPALAV
jgi:hypothetical protein